MTDETTSLAAVILTFNSERSIERTLRSARALAETIHIVDSFSTDNTIEICKRYHCNITQRPFENYAAQRNWAIDNLVLPTWQIHLDADEELTREACEEIRSFLTSPDEFMGLVIPRKIVFMGRTLRHGGISTTWHCRVFRSGTGRCEDRLYDQHFICSGPTRTISGPMLDHQEMTLSQWTASHNRWSDLEAAELCEPSAKGEQVRPSLHTGEIERRRYFKSIYYRLPLFWRPTGYFLYRYIFQLGFLDGIEGAIYHVLQGFWFRYLVDAKIYESRRKRNS